MKINFEDFLKEKFADVSQGVLDDEMSDKYESWLENLDQDELIAFADEYGDAREKGLKPLF